MPSIHKAAEKDRNRGFLHIPAKRFNPGFRVDSRLENDPLPPLSVFIDNMHVDEVQIDGGGTEAVITGNMEGLREGRRSIGFQGIFYANYLQLTVLNWKTQEPCLT